MSYVKGLWTETENDVAILIRDDNGAKVMSAVEEVQECNPPKYYQCEVWVNISSDTKIDKKTKNAFK